MILDNLPLALSAGNGRAGTHLLLRPLRRMCALLLLSSARMIVRWIPSELNSADAPSRGFAKLQLRDAIPARGVARASAGGAASALSGGAAVAASTVTEPEVLVTVDSLDPDDALIGSEVGAEVPAESPAYLVHDVGRLGRRSEAFARRQCGGHLAEEEGRLAGRAESGEGSAEARPGCLSYGAPRLELPGGSDGSPV